MTPGVFPLLQMRRSIATHPNIPPFICFIGDEEALDFTLGQDEDGQIRLYQAHASDMPAYRPTAAWVSMNLPTETALLVASS